MGPSSQANDQRIERHVVAAVRALAGAGFLPMGADGLGLDPGEGAALLQLLEEDRSPVEPTPAEVAPAPLLRPLIALLWEHRASDDAWTRLMAGTIGCACFGQHHLWQDLGLSGRTEVSALLTRHFPALVAGNTRGLRWKRYLFLRLGNELGIDDLAPPRCDGCDEFEVCFPPLDNQPVGIDIRSGR